MLDLKKRQIEEHNSVENKPVLITKPSEQLSSDQQKAATALEEIAAKLKLLEEESITNSNTHSSYAAKLKAIQTVRERLRTLERQFSQFQEDTENDIEVLGLKLGDLATLTINSPVLDKMVVTLEAGQKDLLEKTNQNSLNKNLFLEQQSSQKTKLNEPQLLFQQSLKAVEVWNEKLRELTGAPEVPDTLMGIENRIKQLDDLPILLKNKQNQRRNLTGEIFDVLNNQRKAREDLFKPVQDLIQNNQLIREEYKLQFQATLSGSSEALSSALFALIKQNSGEFKGEDESPAAIKRLSEQFDLSQKADVLICFF